MREVIDALASRPTRDAETGQFIAGLAAGTTLARSEIFWTAIAPIKADLVTRVRTDLALDDAPETVIGLTEAYAEVRLFRQAMFLRLVDLGGPITTKGRSRALYSAYLSALDRETKLATTLGLQRQSKKIDLSDYLEQRYGSRATDATPGPVTEQPVEAAPCPQDAPQIAACSQGAPARDDDPRAEPEARARDVDEGRAS